MLRTIAITLCTCFVMSTGYTMTLPEQFYVRQRWYSWANVFDIETDTLKIGTVTRKLFSWTARYTFNNTQGEIEAEAHRQFFSWGAVFDVIDRQEKRLGKIVEKPYSFFPTFEIISPSGEKLAEARMNFWGTKYVLLAASDHQRIASLSRPFFRRDEWTIQIDDVSVIGDEKIDPRLFVTLMALQTDMELWSDYERSTSTEQLSPEKVSVCKAIDEELALLAPYCEAYASNVPEEKDFTFIEQQLVASSEDPLQDAHLLLDGQELTPEQKSALCEMVQRTLFEKRMRLSV